MNDSTIVALLTAIPPTLAALAAFWVSVTTDRKTDKLAVTVDDNAEASKDRGANLGEKVAEIHVMANANLAAEKTKNGLLEQRVAELQRQVAELQVRAALLTPAPAPFPAAVAAPISVDVVTPIVPVKVVG